MINKLNYVLVMGGPGSGKSTLGKMIANKFQMFYISKGDTSRFNDKEAFDLRNLDTQSRQDSVYHRNVNLSKSQVIVSIIGDTMYDLEVSQIDSNKKKQFLIEGVPKSKQMLFDWHQKIDIFAELKYCIHLQCSKDLMLRRIRGRSNQQTRISDQFQDYQQQRIDKYQKDIKFVKQYYQQKGKLVDVDGTGDPNTVLRRIIKELKKMKFLEK